MSENDGNCPRAFECGHIWRESDRDFDGRGPPPHFSRGLSAPRNCRRAIRAFFDARSVPPLEFTACGRPYQVWPNWPLELVARIHAAAITPAGVSSSCACRRLSRSGQGANLSTFGPVRAEPMLPGADSMKILVVVTTKWCLDDGSGIEREGRPDTSGVRRADCAANDGGVRSGDWLPGHWSAGNPGRPWVLRVISGDWYRPRDERRPLGCASCQPGNDRCQVVRADGLGQVALKSGRQRQLCGILQCRNRTRACSARSRVLFVRRVSPRARPAAAAATTISINRERLGSGSLRSAIGASMHRSWYPMNGSSAPVGSAVSRSIALCGKPRRKAGQPPTSVESICGRRSAPSRTTPRQPRADNSRNAR